MKKFQVIFFTTTLVLSNYLSAQTSTSKNPFSNRADKYFMEYVSYEISEDLKSAVLNYNLNRNKYEYNEKIFNLLKLDKAKLKSLPEIKHRENVYLIEYKKDKIEFSIDLILQGKFKKNGTLLNFSNEKIVYTKNNQLNIYADQFKKFANFLISNAIAGEGFVQDNESTRVLIASLLTLGNGYEKLGLLHLCLLDCKERVAGINRQRLKDRIKSQAEDCESNIEIQEQSIESHKRWKDVFSLKQIDDSDFKNTYGLLKTMAKVQSKNEASGINESAFDSDLEKRGSCTEIVRGTYMLLVHELFAFSTDREAANQDAAALCVEIERLKSCLSTFHAQASSIENTSRAEFKKVIKHDPAATPKIKGIEK